jgi:hypothetical protein
VSRRFSEAELARLQRAGVPSPGQRRPVATMPGSAVVTREAGEAHVRFTVPFRATPMKSLYGGRAAWQAEWGETQRWERVLGGRRGLVLLLPAPVRLALHATGPRRLVVVRSYRGLPLDPGANLPSIIKPVEDALQRLGWLLNDRAVDYLGGAPDVQQQQDARAYTTVTLGPLVLDATEA